jgi:hypothetical protein
MTETRFFGFICHLPMPQQRCAEGLKTWFLWVLLRLFQYLPNSSYITELIRTLFRLQSLR